MKKLGYAQHGRLSPQLEGTKLEASLLRSKFPR
jgi:hypothetical protein